MTGGAADLTDVADKLVDVRFLQQTQLTHAGESVQSFIDDELLGVAQTLLEEGLQDGRALPANVRRHAFSTQEGGTRGLKVNHHLQTNNRARSR